MDLPVPAAYIEGMAHPNDSPEWFDGRFRGVRQDPPEGAVVRGDEATEQLTGRLWRRHGGQWYAVYEIRAAPTT